MSYGLPFQYNNDYTYSVLHSLYQIKLVKVNLPREEHDLNDVLTNAIQVTDPQNLPSNNDCFLYRWQSHTG